MTFEEDLFLVIKAAAPEVVTPSGMGRIYEDFAPASTPRPYVTFQFIGGRAINPIDNTIPSERMPDVQVNVWADTRAQAKRIALAIEAGMHAATAFKATRYAEPANDYDADIPVYGARQDFRCCHST